MHSFEFLSMQVPPKVNLIQSTLLNEDEGRAFTERFEKFGVSSTFFLVQQYLFIVWSLLILALLVISFLVKKTVRGGLQMKIKRLMLQSYMEFFAIAVISSLINLTIPTKSNNMVFDSINYLCSFGFIFTGVVFFCTIFYLVDKAYKKAEGDEEELLEMYPTILKDLKLNSKWSI